MSSNTDIPKAKKLLFLFRHAPYGNSLSKEGIDAVLAASAYDQSISVLFMDDGVFQLTKQQNSEQIQQKNIAHLLSAFEIYDIQSLFVCGDSLIERGLSENSILSGVHLLSSPEVIELLDQQEQCFSF